MAEKTSYCGYVSADSGVNDLDLLRRKFKIDAEKLIVVTAGGGFDGYAMMDTCLEAVRTLAGQRSVGVLMVTGPQMPSDHRALLCRKAKGLPVRVEQHLDHLSDYFRAADLVVTMAGYNTLLEAMSAGVPTVVIPRSGPSAEQRMRANIFAERGLLQMIDPEEVTSQDLGRILNAKLKEPRHARQPPINMNGLAGTIKHLSELADRSHSEKALNKTRFGEPAPGAERLARPA
jgi:predicted glycosyltransferase